MFNSCEDRLWPARWFTYCTLLQGYQATTELRVKPHITLQLWAWIMCVRDSSLHSVWRVSAVFHVVNTVVLRESRDGRAGFTLLLPHYAMFIGWNEFHLPFEVSVFSFDVSLTRLLERMWFPNATSSSEDCVSIVFSLTEHVCVHPQTHTHSLGHKFTAWLLVDDKHIATYFLHKNK